MENCALKFSILVTCDSGLVSCVKRGRLKDTTNFRRNYKLHIKHHLSARPVTPSPCLPQNPTPRPCMSLLYRWKVLVTLRLIISVRSSAYSIGFTSSRGPGARSTQAIFWKIIKEKCSGSVIVPENWFWQVLQWASDQKTGRAGGEKAYRYRRTWDCVLHNSWHLRHKRIALFSIFGSFNKTGNSSPHDMTNFVPVPGVKVYRAIVGKTIRFYDVIIDGGVCGTVGWACRAASLQSLGPFLYL